MFPDSDVYISDFHREQAWDRWMCTTINGIKQLPRHHKNYDELMSLLRDCAKAETERRYYESVVKLHESALWTSNARLRDWFSATWEKEPKVGLFSCSTLCNI